MKVEERVLNVTSTLSGEKIGMAIHKDAAVHLMSVLTDLYKDSELAVIREYSTNAYDSHIEAGVKRPIEVTLPTPLAPFFRVRDYGVGLDPDDIRDIYSQYGASTKRDSNDVVGMLGLGCKSGLTYTDQFTIMGIRNGMKTNASVSRDADGAGSMTIVSYEPTDDPSGVEIIIPAKSGNQFQMKAMQFFRFWKDGDVLVDGAIPPRLDGVWISDDILFTKEVRTSYVVMGNVPYPVADRVLIDSWQFKVVSFVEIGSVAFTPSREDLQMTTRTKETLAQIKDRVEREKNIALKKKINEAKTPWDAIDAYHEVKGMMYNGPSEYKGKSFNVVTRLPEGESYVIVDRADRASYGKYSWGAGSNFNLLNTTSKTHYFYGYESDTMTPYKRQKLAIWATQNKVELTQCIFGNTFPKAIIDWVNPKNVHNWADVDAIKIEREKRINRGDGRPTGSYMAHIAGARSNSVLASDIDTAKPLFWVWASETYGTASFETTWIIKNVADATVVFLSKNRIEKFKRDFPMAVEVNTACRQVAEKWVKKLTKEEKIAIIMDRSSLISFYKALDIDRIDDPNIKEAIKLAKLPEVTIKKLRDDFLVMSRFDSTLINDVWTDPLGKYPLITTRYTSMLSDHFYCYLNAAYKEFHKNNEKEDSV